MNKDIKHQDKQSGFTLIELSIVIIIVGLMLAGFVQAYTIYEAKRKFERSQALMSDINQYLNDFPTKTIPSTIVADALGRLTGTPYDRLPVPAPLNGSTAGNDFGTEIENTPAAINAAVAAGNLIRVPGTAGANILIGKLPTGTLGVHNNYMRDVYGNYVLYAVTEAATTDLSSSGAIIVIEEGVDHRTTSPTAGEIIEYDTHANVQYVVVSMGETEAGAFAFDGSQSIPCPAGTAKESENCDLANGTFRASALSRRDNNQFYDDAVVFETSLVGTASTQPPANCPQIETFTVQREVCPDGWTRTALDDLKTSVAGDTHDSISSNAANHLIINSTGRGYRSLGSETFTRYMNIDSETNDYYFTANRNSETIYDSWESDYWNDAHVGSLCTKDAGNTAQTKCYSKTLTLTSRTGSNRTGDGTSGSATRAQNEAQEQLENNTACPEGWKAIDLQPYTTSGPGGNGETNTYHHLNIQCVQN